MESLGEPGYMHVGESAHELLCHEFELESRGRIEVKGKGSMPTWFLVREHER